MAHSIFDTLVGNRLRNIEKLLKQILAELRELNDGDKPRWPVGDDGQDNADDDTEGVGDAADQADAVAKCKCNTTVNVYNDNIIVIIVVFFLFFGGGAAGATPEALAELVQSLRNVQEED
jgi:hypothetical protein